nr:hypothetical protein [Tanacetum cinerariifolium]
MQTSSAGASLILSNGNLSSLAVGKFFGSGNFITGSGNDLSILFPTTNTVVLEKFCLAVFTIPDFSSTALGTKFFLACGNFGEPSSLFDFEEIISIPHNNKGPPPAGPPPQDNNGPPPVVRPNGLAPDLRSMMELCQPSIN